MKLHLYWFENVIHFRDPSHKKNCPTFLCFNQRHFISITLSRWCHVSLNFWSTVNENYYMAGSIPFARLSGSCKEDGFSVIPTQFHSRLVNASSSKSSYHCYKKFGHYLMWWTAANNCNMHQHRKGITSSTTSAGGLDLFFNDDSNFLHSIDSRQMVKILFASQEYFQWDIFLTLTCNIRFFCAKPVREWLDDK